MSDRTEPNIVPLRPAPVLETVCADCGAVVEWDPIKDRWGSKIMDNAHTTAWVFTCRFERRGTLVLSADYHYVEPEQQRHFRLGEGETT